MNHLLPRALVLGLLASAATAVAQTDLSFLFTTRPKYWFSTSLDIRSGGPSVHFGNLGTLPRQIIDLPNNQVIFDDGTVGNDGVRQDQVAPTTTFNADKSRYQTYGLQADGVTTGQTGDFLSYQAGLTRVWAIGDGSQVHGDEVDFHSAGAVAEGASGDSVGKSSAGVDLQLSRDFGLIGKRGAWGFTFAVGINDISGKTSQTVTSALRVLTAKYSLNGATLPANSENNPFYSAPVILPFTNPVNGTEPPTGGFEETIPLSQLPTSTSTADTTDGATVSGIWRLKGAYYLARLGPQARFFLGKHFSISASGGVAAAYVGSEFHITESLVSPVLISGPSFDATSRQKTIKTGAFGEVNLEYWVTFRTGFFAGAVYEHLGKYNQSFDDATATINIGSGTNFRLGVITRF